MKKSLGALIAVPLLAVGLAACGGGGGTTTAETTAAAPPAQTAEPTTGATTGSESLAVATYCEKVDEYAQQAKKMLQDPTSVNAKELQQAAQELQDTAAVLTQELIENPDLSQRVQECTTKLQEALAG